MILRPFQSEAIDGLRAAWPNKPEALSPEDLSILRELFGPKFLTQDYNLASLVGIDD